MQYNCIVGSLYANLYIMIHVMCCRNAFANHDIIFMSYHLPLTHMLPHTQKLENAELFTVWTCPVHLSAQRS